MSNQNSMTNVTKSYGMLIRGILLIAGTTIGGGMLALPVLTGQVGFVPSLFIYFFSWLFMMITGLLFLEIALWMEPEANIITMAEKTLGGWGKAMAWGLYLFLFYCLTLAYIVGMGDLIVESLQGAVQLKEWQGELLFLGLFGPFVYAGARIIGRFNLFLMLGLGVSFIAFLVLGVPFVNSDLLMTARWSSLWAALPITFIAFAYQGVVPTLVQYMERDVVQIRKAIIIGSFLPLIVYAIWQWLILGIVPVEGKGGLTDAMHQGVTAVQPLKEILNTSSIYVVGQYFAFFALLTSFFGVAMGLVDFLADGLKIKKNKTGKLALCLLIFVPPLLFAYTHPKIFLLALDYAGGFGSALLLGLLPVLMVWSGRYFKGFEGSYKVAGGRILLTALILFVVIELCCQLTLMNH